MKIEIDLDELLSDPSGMSVKETIQTMIRNRLEEDLQETVLNEIKYRISELFDERFVQAIHLRLPALVEEVINTPFVPTDSYGERETAVTFRNQIIRTLHGELTLQKGHSNRMSRSNLMTEAVNELVKDELKRFSKEYTSLVNEMFTREAMDLAAKKLAERLKV
jgi:hypothetical protein